MSSFHKRPFHKRNDRDSNRTFRENRVSVVISELYTYDNLDRVTSFQRGIPNAAKEAIPNLFALFAGVPMTGNVSSNWDTEGTDDTELL